MHAGEAAIGIDLRVRLDFNSGLAQLGQHGVQACNAEVDHPRLAGIAEIRGGFGERRQLSGAGLLLPGRLAIVRWRRVYAKTIAVPLSESGGIPRAKEDAADTIHSFHALATRLFPRDQHARRVMNLPDEMIFD